MRRRFTVHLSDTSVGALIEREDGRVEFRPAPGWANAPRRPVLGQQFEDDPAKIWRAKRNVLPRWFENVLPEVGSPLRALVAADAGVTPDDDLGLLAHIGADLPGATLIRAGDGELAEGGGSDDDPSDELPALRSDGLKFSLAGIQLKFSLVHRAGRYTLPASGELGRWIVKLARAGTTPGVAENEYSMMRWAQAAGFDVPPVALVEPGEIGALPDPGPWQTALAIGRYDRTAEGARVHQEDFAQILDLRAKDKYARTADQLVPVVDGVLGVAGLEEFLRRQLLAIACGNADAHVKNWSVVYPDRITPAWAPLYDQVSTVAWPEHNQDLALKLGGIKRMADLDRRALHRATARVDADPRWVDGVIDATLRSLAEAWVRVSDTLPLWTPHRRALEAHWRAVPLLAPLADGR